ncbi:hypothetical protein [Ferrimonas marina]|uniref:Uncharacterized protein n=1 Tax=Ferrimonas marina TaxID=299255 RepID=A0A1M5X3R3_9GAMM|nr:hypothetical protein [Ferrimonas marina]SHH94421.1 hypothetical protein SAMN02745129_3199 [Ferrimonas marina]
MTVIWGYLTLGAMVVLWARLKRGYLLGQVQPTGRATWLVYASLCLLFWPLILLDLMTAGSVAPRRRDWHQSDPCDDTIPTDRRWSFQRHWLAQQKQKERVRQRQDQ